MDPSSVESLSVLIKRARTGDQLAFGEIVRRHQHEVYTLATRLVRDPHMANDVAQDAFVRAWRALPGFRGEAAFSTWMHRITVNTAWTARRKAARHQALPLDAADHVADATATRQPEAAGENAYLRRMLEEALRSLPDAYRAVIVMKDVYGWSHREIADTLDISVAAAKVRLHRARKLLREQL